LGSTPRQGPPVRGPVASLFNYVETYLWNADECCRTLIFEFDLRKFASNLAEQRSYGIFFILVLLRCVPDI